MEFDIEFLSDDNLWRPWHASDSLLMSSSKELLCVAIKQVIREEKFKTFKLRFDMVKLDNIQV